VSVVGVGIDLVDVERLARVLERRPGMLDRLFTATEQAAASSSGRRAERLAARFAAKEALMKALGIGLGGFRLADCEVVNDGSGRPTLVLHATARDAAARAGVGRLDVSLTHTSTMASAVVLAEALA
jgi:holo-[acyl-carrier protein] synthase